MFLHTKICNSLPGDAPFGTEWVKKKGVGKGGKNKTSFVRLRYIQYDTVALQKK